MTFYDIPIFQFSIRALVFAKIAMTSLAYHYNTLNPILPGKGKGYKGELLDHFVV